MRLQWQGSLRETRHRQQRARQWFAAFRRHGTNLLQRLPQEDPPLRAIQARYLTLDDWKHLMAFLGAHQALQPLLAPFGAPDFSEIHAQLLRTFDPDGNILRSASPRISQLLDEREEVWREFRREIEQFLEEAGDLLQESWWTFRSGRVVVPVRTDRFRPSLFIEWARSGTEATIFAEPLAFVPWNDRLAELRRKLEEEVHRLLADLLAELRTLLPSLNQARRLLEEAAFFAGVYAWAAAVSATFPELTEDGSYEVRALRHPLLGEKAVPNDFLLPSERPVLVVTGSNGGGKTVFLKSILLAVVLAEHGLPIPAASGRLSIPRSIVAIFPQEEHTEEALSSHTRTMKQLADGLKRLGEGGVLFLLDEVGASTQPEEGSALLEVVLEYLAQQRAPAVASTHFAGVQRRALQHEAMQVASFGVDAAYRPTFRLTYGLPGASFGLEAALRAGLPRDLVESARQRISEPIRELEDALAQVHHLLDRLRRETQTRHRLLDLLRRLYAEMRATYAHLEERYRAQMRLELQRRAQRLRALLERGEQLLEEIQRAPQKSRAQLRDIEEHLKQELQDEEFERLPAPRPARLKNLGIPVEVLSHPNRRGIVLVKLEGEEMRLPLHTLDMPQPERELVIDLRKRSRAEALRRLQETLEEAEARGVRSIRVQQGRVK